MSPAISSRLDLMWSARDFMSSRDISTTIRLQTGASTATFKTPAKLLGLSCLIGQLARVVLTPASTAGTQWRVNVQYA